MSITYNNMTVTKVVTEKDYYDTNKKKHIKYKKPKISKTKIYEGSPYCIDHLIGGLLWGKYILNIGCIY